MLKVWALTAIGRRAHLENVQPNELLGLEGAIAATFPIRSVTIPNLERAYHSPRAEFLAAFNGLFEFHFHAAQL